MSDPFAFRLLRLLSDGEFHSGSALAQQLNVSRGTIWNGVRSLEAAGVEVYRVRGRGYRLAHPLSLLDAGAIARHAGDTAGQYAIEVVDVVDSTNTLAMARAGAGDRSGRVLAAEWQTGGRGRMGRSWHAGIGEGVMFSLLWRFE